LISCATCQQRAADLAPGILRAVAGLVLCRVGLLELLHGFEPSREELASKPVAAPSYNASKARVSLSRAASCGARKPNACRSSMASAGAEPASARGSSGPNATARKAPVWCSRSCWQ